ncbi:type II secretion system minor pseudopilin GspJ [Thiomicrospira cyclica]|uniref:Type II secretion system protein J n=1 Tax=Thiomicrospira cyclica (strain DSM 14477 / JCM 11371 / ALM1) TaxID=717773 RepID=F6DD31_THICA|nr:type II secretion system minor pseudopilin GspJ [Thiomicrospira cyclica]AEG31767.1 general secretion pathway protein J [Thiomicrospira cyclica ALM1]
MKRALVRSQQGGFTLIELLIAIAVSAVIALLAYQSITSAVRVNEAHQAQQSALNQLQRAIWWLEQDIMQMAPRPVLDELGSSLAAMQLQPNQLELTRIALYPTPVSSGGLVRVRYVLEDGQLVRLSWAVLDRAPDSQPRRQVLLDDVVDFKVRVLDSRQEWLEFWPAIDQSLETLPGLVEVELVLKKQGQLRRLLHGVEGMPADARS